MKVIRAKTAGFCMGVDLALRKLNKVVNAGGVRPIFMLGPIIHNPQVLEEYERMGVRRADVPEDVPDGSCVVVRAHGIPRSVEQALKERGVDIVDATCPKVKKAQLLIEEQTVKGRRLLLFGEGDHPEVKGLRSYARDDSFVFDSLDLLKKENIPGNVPHFLAAQTTQDRKAFEKIVDYLLDRLGDDVPVLNTICDATKERQQEAVDTAKKVEAMVVAGGFDSGNTRRLADVVEAQGIYCVHVETADQLPVPEIKGFSVVGLTGGASTPKKIIDSIEEKLKAM